MAQITLRGHSVNTNGQLPAVGTTAPDFTLVDPDLRESNLESFAGKKKVLNIVPSIDTAICATSLKTFYAKLKNRDDVVVLTISGDLPFAFKRFCAAEGTENAVTMSTFRSSFPEDYGQRIIDGPLRGLCARAVVVLDENNKVVHTEQVAEIGNEPDYRAAIAAV